MVASILAAVMSSLDAGILGYGGIVVNNIYQEHFVKKGSSQHYLLMTRIFAGVGLAIAWIIATADISLVEFTTIVEPMGALTGIAILTALVWRRVTAAGAVASVLVVGPLFLAVSRPAWGFGDSSSLFEVMQLRPLAEMLLGWYDLDVNAFVDPETGLFKTLPVQVRYPMFILPTFAILIIVSLFTKQHNERSVAEFYCRLDTPVGDEQKIRDAGFTADRLEALNSEVATQEISEAARHERLLISDLLYLLGLLRRGEVSLRDYKIDLIGLFASTVFVIAFLVLGVHLLGLWLFHDGCRCRSRR